MVTSVYEHTHTSTQILVKPTAPCAGIAIESCAHVCESKKGYQGAYTLELRIARPCAWFRHTSLPALSVAGPCAWLRRVCALQLRIARPCAWFRHTDSPESRINIAAARAVDREFNYNFCSNLGRLGSGRGSNYNFGSNLGQIVFSKHETRVNEMEIQKAWLVIEC